MLSVTLNKEETIFYGREKMAKIADLTFHDLRHDFTHRACEAGWSLEEVAYYLGYVTKKGTLAIQTTQIMA